MDVRRLKLLHTVAEAGSISGAADALSYATSSVSEQIRALEREVGLPLLERANRGVRLTAAGRLLVEHADRILAQVAAARADLDDLAGLRAGELHVSAFSTAGALLLPRATAAFSTASPAVKLHISEADPDEALARLSAGEDDLALVYEFESQPMRLPEGLEQHDLLTDTLHLIAPRGHAATRGDVVELSSLAGQRWVKGVRHGSTADLVPAACRAAGFEPKVVMATDDPIAVQGFVAAGLGVAVISELILPVTRPDVDIRPLLPPLRRVIRVARRAANPPAPAEAAMLSALEDVAARMRDQADLSRPSASRPRPRG